MNCFSDLYWVVLPISLGYFGYQSPWLQISVFVEGQWSGESGGGWVMGRPACGPCLCVDSDKPLEYKHWTVPQWSFWSRECRPNLRFSITVCITAHGYYRTRWKRTRYPCEAREPREILVDGICNSPIGAPVWCIVGSHLHDHERPPLGIPRVGTEIQWWACAAWLDAHPVQACHANVGDSMFGVCVKKYKGRINCFLRMISLMKNAMKYPLMTVDSFLSNKR